MMNNEFIKACGVVCNDNRFELIKQYTKELLDHTNIETSKQEMEVIDNVLFRFWQMGWLDKLEECDRQKAEIERLQCEVKNCCDVIKEQSDEWHKHYNDSVTYKTALDSVCKELRTAKSEARKEFAEKLKEKHSQSDIFVPRRIISLSEQALDNLLKEMEGEE